MASWPSQSLVPSAGRPPRGLGGRVGPACAGCRSGWPAPCRPVAGAHTGVDASQLGGAPFSDLEALVGDRRLSGAQRRGVLWPLGAAPDGGLCVVLQLPGDLQRAADDGGDYLQSKTLLALCRL